MTPFFPERSNIYSEPFGDTAREYSSEKELKLRIVSITHNSIFMCASGTLFLLNVRRLRRLVMGHKVQLFFKQIDLAS